MGKTLDALLIELAAGKTPWKLPCRAATTANHALTGLAPVGGVAIQEGDRVLVPAQTDKKQNCIYNASSGVWARALDASTDLFLSVGMTIKVLEGTETGEWALTSPTSGATRLGIDELEFERVDTLRYFPSPTQLKIDEALVSAVRGNDAVASLAEPQVLEVRAGRCHVADINARPWANIKLRFGKIADSTSGEAGGVNAFYNDDRSGDAEGEWIGAEFTFIGDPLGDGRDPIWRMHSSTNPVTGVHVPILIGGKGGLSLTSANGAIALQAGANKPIGTILTGPAGTARTREVGGKHSANGAVTVKVLDSTILNTDMVPYQSQAGSRQFSICELKIIARDIAASTWETYICHFVWVGGRTIAQGGAIAAIPTEVFNARSSVDGTPAGTPEIGLVGSGKRVTIEDDGSAGGLCVKFTGRGGVNMNEVSAWVKIIESA